MSETMIKKKAMSQVELVYGNLKKIKRRKK